MRISKHKGWKACGDRCNGYGACNKLGTKVVCDFTLIAMGCEIGEPFGMFYVMLENT